MIPETHIAEWPKRENPNQEVIRRILGIGLIVALLCGALAVLRRRKATVLRPLITLALIGIAFALLVRLLKAIRSRAAGNT